jgi:hypothetical protein
MRSLSLALIAAACLALAACGGDDSGDQPPADGDGPGASEPGGDQGAPDSGAKGAEGEQAPEGGRKAGPEAKVAIRTTIEKAIASGDPERACGGAVTESFLIQTYGDAAGCREAQSEDSAAVSVEVGQISIGGDQARTTVRAEGGTYAGEELRALLVRVGDSWRLHRLNSDAPPGP